MPATNLTPESRREIALARLSGESPTDIAKRYPISRQHVYDIERWAREDVGAELEFWRRVAEIIG
jgi:uncharacterized protein (DUF433 family)